MKLFLSPTISNSNEDPVGEYKGPVFCSNDWSNVTKRWGFSNKSNELCVASVGITMLVRIFYFWEKIWSTPLWLRCSRNDLFLWWRLLFVCFLLRPPSIDCFSSSLKCSSNLFSSCFCNCTFQSLLRWFLFCCKF